MNVRLYGITAEVFDEALELEQSGPLPGLETNDENVVHYRISYEKLYERYQTGGCMLEELLNADITQSGNYYVDYPALCAGRNYKQLLYVVTYDHDAERKDCAFSIHGMHYNIEDEAQYQQWKEQHLTAYLR